MARFRACLLPEPRPPRASHEVVFLFRGEGEAGAGARLVGERVEHRAERPRGAREARARSVHRGVEIERAAPFDLDRVDAARGIGVAIEDMAARIRRVERVREPRGLGLGFEAMDEAVGGGAAETVAELKRQADDSFRRKEKQPQQELSDTERKLTELQSAKSQDQAMVLSAEQKAELDNFLKRKVEIRKQLRDVRRQLDADIDALGMRLKFVNILLVPLLLIIAALGFVGWKARRAKR